MTRPGRERAATHGQSLARMRATLAAAFQPAPVRALAHRPADDPMIALLDSWAVVADIVSFYNQRIAEEGFLCTATELRSVRELARSLGHELLPGVAATAELAFTVEDAIGAPPIVTVPQGTPVQSIPEQDQHPQIFQTAAALEARAAWNAIPGIATLPQKPRFGSTQLWLTGTATGVRPGDALLVVGQERIEPNGAPDDEHWDLRTVAAVAADPEGHPGWTLLKLSPPHTSGDLVSTMSAQVHTFTERAQLFGWNAPDPKLLTGPGGTAPPGRVDGQWDNFKLPTSSSPDMLELDGDHPEILAGSWLVLENPRRRALYRVLSVTPSGAARYGLSGRITQVRLDTTEHLSDFDRRDTLVHCLTVRLPAERMPQTAPVTGRKLKLTAADPPLPAGRPVLIRGTDVRTGTSEVETASVLTCTVKPDTVMTVTLDRELSGSYAPATLTLLGNVVAATHGETVTQVLGSGDGRDAFARLGTRRGPLTYLPAANPMGAASTFTLRVDGAVWTEVRSLSEAGPHDRVFMVRNREDGTAVAVFGDGVHGARLPTGTENVTAGYRVGNGADGAVAAGQLGLLLRRPLGIREVTNPAAAHDWAPMESLEDVQRTAPLRVRTLDRAVSVADHEDFARGFAGVGAARADLVWDGRQPLVVLSLTGTGASQAGDGLLADLATALGNARAPGTPLVLLNGDILPFGVRVEVRHDPAYEWPTVRDAITAALERQFTAARRDFGAPVTASAVLVAVRSVPGVLACTMPRLLRLPDTAAVQVLTTLTARWESGKVLPAQLLGLARDKVEIGVMA